MELDTGIAEFFRDSLKIVERNRKPPFPELLALGFGFRTTRPWRGSEPPQRSRHLTGRRPSPLLAPKVPPRTRALETAPNPERKPRTCRDRLDSCAGRSYRSLRGRRLVISWKLYVWQPNWTPAMSEDFVAALSLSKPMAGTLAFNKSRREIFMAFLHGVSWHGVSWPTG